MDKDELELEKELKEISGKVDAMATLVEKGICNNEGVAEIKTELGTLTVRLETAEKHQTDVERKLDKARAGGTGFGQGMDALKDAIPERYRGTMDTYARTANGGKRTLIHTSGRRIEIPNEPVVSCALESWMKNVLRLSLQEYSGIHAQIHEENARLIEAMGCDAAQMARMKAAYAEGAGGTGAFTVPSPLEARVLRIVEDSSVVRPNAQVMTMTAFKHFLPADSTSITVAKVLEAGTIAQSETTFTQKTLEALMIAVRGIASMQVVQDSNIGLLDYWLTRASEAYGLYEDAQALEGDGTDFTGYSDDTGLNEILATITPGGIDTNGGPPHVSQLTRTVYGATKRSTRSQAVWYMHPAVLAATVGKETADGQPAFNRQDIARVLSQNIIGPGFGEGTLFGYPVWTSDQISIARTKGTLSEASNIYFGPGNAILIGDLLGLQFGVSEHVLWNSAQLSMRLLKRTGIIVQLPAAVTRLINVDSN